MAAITAIVAAVGVAASVAGTVMGVVAQNKQAGAQEKAEKLREQQMNLEAERKQRQIRREQIIARSQAVSNATAQGAGEGTGLQGAFGQISQVAGSQSVATEQNRQIGAGIFQANAEGARAGGMAATAQGINSLGGAIISNYGTFGRVGQYASGQQTQQTGRLYS